MCRRMYEVSEENKATNTHYQITFVEGRVPIDSILFGSPE